MADLEAAEERGEGLGAKGAELAGDLGPLRRKPLSTLFRRLQIRHELRYWLP